jgi:hypothetical protein
MTRSLDFGGHLSLLLSAQTADPGSNDSPPLGDKLPKRLDVLIVENEIDRRPRAPARKHFTPAFSTFTACTTPV